MKEGTGCSGRLPQAGETSWPTPGSKERVSTPPTLSILRRDREPRLLSCSSLMGPFPKGYSGARGQAGPALSLDCLCLHRPPYPPGQWDPLCAHWAEQPLQKQHRRHPEEAGQPGLTAQHPGQQAGAQLCPPCFRWDLDQLVEGARVPLAMLSWGALGCGEGDFCCSASASCPCQRRGQPGVVTLPERGTVSGSQKYLWTRLGTQGVVTGIVDGWAGVPSLCDMS